MKDKKSCNLLILAVSGVYLSVSPPVGVGKDLIKIANGSGVLLGSNFAAITHPMLTTRPIVIGDNDMKAKIKSMIKEEFYG